MPEKKTTKKAQAAKRSGKSASTAAGEFVHEEMHHVHQGKHGARSAKQAIAIGLSKARRAGVKVKAPKKGTASAKTRASAKRDNATGEGNRKPRAPSATRSAASKAALRREPRSTASHRALSAHAHKAAAKRTKAERSAAAKKGARTRARNAAK